MGDDDGVGDELALKCRGDHAVKGFLLAPEAQVQRPEEVAHGGGAPQPRVAVDEEAVFALCSTARVQPVEEGRDFFPIRCVGVFGKVGVVEETLAVVLGGDPRWAKVGALLWAGAGVLQGDEVGGGEAGPGVGPVAWADEELDGCWLLWVVSLLFGLVALAEGGFLFLYVLASVEFHAGCQHGVGDDLAGAAGACGGVGVGGGAVGCDAHAGGGGDGVLVGPEEEEFPAILFALMGDALLDLCEGVLGG